MSVLLTQKTQTRFGPVKLLILGLQGSGKTTLVKKMKKQLDLNNPISAGISLDSFCYNGINFISYDIDGREPFRKLVWPKFVKMTDVTIYLIDGTDKEHIKDSIKELQNISRHIGEEQLLIVLINKIDVGTYVRTDTIVKALKTNIPRKNVLISYVSILSNHSIERIFNYVSKVFRKKLERAHMQNKSFFSEHPSYFL